ncbi:hypothetical protein [Kitasatospora sp. NPDC051914]|uniref:hypothetical protein n=1 Tax=Kitasatospora sp. NPDC051914 TaxID=3154945 RepID=UPI00343074C1
MCRSTLGTQAAHGDQDAVDDIEGAHIEGLAQFIRKSDIHHPDLPQAAGGFL